MTKDQIIEMAKQAWLSDKEAQLITEFDEAYISCTYLQDLERFAILVAQQQREEDAKLVENITLEWPDQPEFAQVERTTIQDCAKIIRQRVVTYD